jgi:hypothetical protein
LYTAGIGLGQPPPAPVPIPELSAAEERNEARSWRSVVVAGLERRIDMKVIEPYKRVSYTFKFVSMNYMFVVASPACQRWILIIFVTDWFSYMYKSALNQTVQVSW